MAYNLSKRWNCELVETGVESYMTALLLTEKYPNCDIIIHPDTETCMEYMQRTSREPYDITQGGWAFI